jgi:Tfp pilus assembly protein PilO
MATSRQTQLATMLLKFYDRPVAKVSLELFFSVAAVIVFALFAIRPTISTMGKLIKELEDKQALNQRLAQKAASLLTAQGQYASLRDRVTVLDQVIPPTPRFEEALVIIEKIASEGQLTIVAMQAKEVPQEPISDVPFSVKSRTSRPIVLTVTGDYPAIRQLIENIHNSRRALIVDTVVFNVIEQRGQRVLQANITINVPFFAADQALLQAIATQSAAPAPTEQQP